MRRRKGKLGIFGRCDAGNRLYIAGKKSRLREVDCWLHLKVLVLHCHCQWSTTSSAAIAK